MKILLLNQAFYPDIVSTAQHASDLARGLTDAGHEVTVICNSRGYDDPTLKFLHEETWNGIKILRVRSTTFGKRAKWRRVCDFGTFMISCALRIWSLRKFDVVVALTSPPLISFLAALAVPHKARKLLFWSMDLNPDEAIAAGWLRDRSVAARLLSWMLLHSLQRADRIVALDRFMKDRIESKGISPEKVLVVPPWSHDDQVRFDPLAREEFRDLHNLTGRFVIMYSGNHSPCHPLETLLQAAERLADHEDIVFCFIGGGTEFRKVQDRSVAGGMRNVRCFPYLPLEKLAGSLSAADLQVVVMGNKYVGIIHPCKIYNVLAANRSFLYIGPPDSHVQDIVSQVGRGAYVARHGDVEGVVVNILRAMRCHTTLSPTTSELGKRFSKDLLIPQMICAIEQCRDTNTTS